jgi:hypothetical protein
MITMKKRYSGFLPVTAAIVAAIWLFACQTLPGL